MREINEAVLVTKSYLPKKSIIIDETVTLIVIASGSAEVFAYGKIYKANYGSAFMFLPGEYAEVYSKNATAYKLVFNYSCLSGESLRQTLLLKSRIACFNEEEFSLILDYISCLKTLSGRKKENDGKIVDKLFYVLTSEFCNKKTLTGEVDDSPLGKIIYFAHNLEKPSQKLNAVSEYAGITPNYLCSLFKGRTGVNYNKYVKRMRLREAEKLLLDGKQVKDVAKSCGFQSYSHFMSDFKEVFSLTPNAYKKLHS